MNAQIDRTKPPRSAAAPEVRGAHDTFLLANGMRVMWSRTTSSPWSACR
ncbi:MAG: hypothetical protein IPK99_00270 [Flavobacteriales bacterium]|nr:hypothetical protein [Flavobacteriales bacterium]